MNTKTDKNAQSVNADVAILTSAHPPFDTRIFLKQARSIARSGRHVTLICPSAKFEIVDGVNFIGIEKSEGRLGRMLVTAFRVFRAALLSKAPICHFHDPELIPAGLILKLFGRKVIYDVHEDVPRSILSKDWIPPLLRGLVAITVKGIEWLAAASFDQIIAATPAIGARFPCKKMTLVQNFPIIEDLNNEIEIAYQKRPAQIVYLGAVTRARGAIEIVDAMELVNEKSTVQLSIAGNVSPKGLRSELEKKNGWAHIDFLGMLKFSQLAGLLGQSRLGLVLFHPEPNHINAQPTKLFEYMAVGLPVIASDFPLWREIIGDNGAGLLVDPTDSKAIAKAITWLLTHEKEAVQMGQRGRKAVHSCYNWAVEEKILLALYGKLDAEIRNNS